MYDLWFDILPGNMTQLTTDQKSLIKETFMEGGYYRVDLTDKISVLALNTLYFDAERCQDCDEISEGIENKSIA